ncbi:ABC transporter substrate-binding protein [Leptolyngbya sp. 7M]|nr:ABC transporter substrate-binding protein [Leptolyngbya sp. 7M]
METPDSKTVVFTVARPSLKNQLLSNLVAIPVIAEGTAETQKDTPIGSGPFKFVRFDASQNTVEMEAFADYFEGSPKVPKILVKTVTDASSLQAELQTGGVDIAPMPTNLPPDTLNILGQDANLKIEQFDGSNIQYIGLNTRSAPLDKVKVRQAIGYAVDRDKLIRELLSGQAKKANSILPESSWAYTPGVEYNYDPAKAKQLLAEAGYKNEPIKFKFSSGNAAFNSYVQAIQNNLKEVGLNVEIEPLDPGTLRDQLRNGQFQLNTGVWIGGNQDPIFLKDLFTTGRIPGPGVACCNRSRYSNPEVDTLIQEAIDAIDREVAKVKYQAAWAKISEELPLMPLWYPANMVVANKRISGIRVSPSGDWGFIRNIELSK